MVVLRLRIPTHYVLLCGKENGELCNWFESEKVNKVSLLSFGLH